jgi:hypothetical protein
MARLANRPADRLKVCQGTTPAASQTDPALRAYIGQLTDAALQDQQSRADACPVLPVFGLLFTERRMPKFPETKPTDCPDEAITEAGRLRSRRTRNRTSNRGRQRYRDHDMALIEASIGTAIGSSRQLRRSKPEITNWKA